MTPQIYIDGNRIDLFETENVELKSSIIDASDIQKTTTDFSKEFTVPASPRNNIYFKHYYDANIDNSFDARIKVKGKIDLSGHPFKFGKFRLLKVNVRKGKPYSYTINFVGNLTDIKKTIGNDLLSSLDLSAYNHSFDGNTVKQGLTSSLFSGELIYTLNPKRQYFYNSDTNDTTDLDTLTNIAQHANGASNGVRFSDLSPSIKARVILDAIQSKYNLTFSDDFFGTSEFTGLFQTLTNTKEGISGGSQIVDFDGGDTNNVSLVSDTGSFFTQATAASNDNISWQLRLSITPSTGYENVSYNVTTIIDDNDGSSEDGQGFQVFGDTLTVNGQTTYQVQYRITASEEFKYTAVWSQQRYSTVPTDPDFQEWFTTASENTLLSEFITSDNIPKIKIIDWLVGMFKAFKLVIIPQEDESFYIDTLNRYYEKGRLLDVTKYIDFESYDVSRGTLFNEINFSFEDPETILNQQFEKNTGLAYGNEEVELVDENNDPLDGDKYDIEVPFETVVYDRLRDTNTNTLTPIMYAPFVDEDVNPTFPATNFFYNIPQGISATPIRFINNNEVAETLSGVINTAFHCDEVGLSNYSFLFGQEYSEWDGAQTSNNLYSNHHKKYIDSVFNIRRRNFKYKAVFPLHISTTLALNDVLKIKSDYYRIDSYSTNINTGETTLNLINSFDNTLERLLSNRDTLYFNPTGGSKTSLVNTDNVSTVITDLGFGIDWVTVTQQDNNLNISLNTNVSGQDRSAMVVVTDIDKNKTTTDVLVFQKG